MCRMWLAWLSVGGLAVASSPADTPTLDHRVQESSGLVASLVHPGILWTHNDSGGEATLFAVDRRGELRSVLHVVGATSRDWEDVTRGADHRLWVGDIGNNANRRRDLAVFEIPEPLELKAEQTVQVLRRVQFSFPDQREFPPTVRSFDAEALFWYDNTLWLFSKRREDTLTSLYRFPAVQGEVELEFVSNLELGGATHPFGGLVTAADVRADGAVALLTYHAVFMLAPAAPGAWSMDSAHHIALDPVVAGQCEGIAFDGNAVVFTNESGRIFRIEDPWAVVHFPSVRR